MKSLLFLVNGFLCLSTTWGMQGWETDINRAKQKAVEQNKDLFIVYKGTDWSPDETGKPEKMLTADIFKQMTGKQFILVAQDYPIPGKDKKNTQTTYETAIVFADPKGRPFNDVTAGGLSNGYTWIQGEMEFAQKKKKKCFELFETIEKATGKEKYEAIGHFFNDVYNWQNRGLYPLFEAWTEECLTKDQKNVSGLKLRKQFYDSFGENEWNQFLQFYLNLIFISEEESQKELKQLSSQIPEKYRTPLLQLAKILKQLHTAKTAKTKKELWNKISLLEKKEFSAVFPNSRNLLQTTALFFYFYEFIKNKKLKSSENIDQFETLINDVFSPVISFSPDSKQAALSVNYLKGIIPVVCFLQNELPNHEAGQSKVLIKNAEELLKKIGTLKRTKNLSLENLQMLMLVESLVFCKKGDLETGLKLLRETRNMAPWTENAKNADMSLNKITENKKLVSLLLKQLNEGKTERIEELKQLLSTKLDFRWYLPFCN